MRFLGICIITFLVFLVCRAIDLILVGRESWTATAWLMVIFIGGNIINIVRSAWSTHSFRQYGINSLNRQLEELAKEDEDS